MRLGDVVIRNVLITGAAGFIGSHLAELCVESGCRVRAFVRYNSRNGWGWLEASEHKDSIEVVTGDIRDLDAVLAAMQDIDTVFHLAALIGIPYSYVSPLAYIRTNIEGTYNVLQAARQHETSNVLITSTSETYGTAQYAPMDEQHPQVGQSPYAATKIAADQLALSFYRSFELPVKVVRPFNTYGPRQSARAIIPTLIAQVLAGQTTVTLGSQHPTRDFTFVKDTASAFLAIARSDRLFGEVTNVGRNDEISMGELAQLVGKLLHIDLRMVTDGERVRPDRSEVERLRCDNSKLITSTSWQPRYSLEAGLQETIAWFDQNVQTYKPDIYNV